MDWVVKMINTNRRGLILGLSSLIVAPAIVRAASLMPVKSYLSKEKMIQLVLENMGKDLIKTFRIGDIVKFSIVDGEFTVTQISSDKMYLNND